MTLTEKKCTACSGDVPALTQAQIASLKGEVQGWQVEGEKRLWKSFRFDNFQKAMNLAEKIARIADEENHHPDLLVRWGELKVEIWTHKIDALTENDFILAAKIDECARAS
jgi:4a-hydroxytetrahydrobiopterin dehydratase